MVRIILLASVFLIALSGCTAPPSSQDAESEIRRLEALWTKAEIAKDAATVGTLLADDFVYVDPDGNPMSAREDLSGIGDPDFRVESYGVSGLKVRVYGDMAIVTGVETLKHASYAGQDLSGRYRMVTVWVRRSGAWKAEHAQETLIKE